MGIYTARLENGRWGDPELVVPPKGGIPNWNPVLFKSSQTGEVLLFYKVGKTPASWRGFLLRSTDNGNTWGNPEILPEV